MQTDTQTGQTGRQTSVGRQTGRHGLLWSMLFGAAAASKLGRERESWQTLFVLSERSLRKLREKQSASRLRGLDSCVVFWGHIFQRAFERLLNSKWQNRQPADRNQGRPGEVEFNCGAAFQAELLLGCADALFTITSSIYSRN